jgi:hypothetical protein
MNNRVVIPVADLDDHANHDCKLGPEHGCTICEARALFYKRSNEKWQNFLDRTGIGKVKTSQTFPLDLRLVSAIMMPDKKEDKQHANA